MNRHTFALQIHTGKRNEFRSALGQIWPSLRELLYTLDVHNYSLWNIDDLAFGYDEIDVTMEQDETPESRQTTIDWETNMLNIMDWITDDVDWITGQRHGHIIRLAYYQ